MIAPNVNSSSKIGRELDVVVENLTAQNIATVGGVVSGLEVTSALNLTLRVGSGSFFIDGTLGSLTYNIEGFRPHSIEPKTRGFVVIRKSEVSTTALDVFGISRVVRIDSSFTVEAVAFDARLGSDLVLAHYEVVEHFIETDTIEYVSVPSSGLVTRIPSSGPFLVPSFQNGLSNIQVFEIPPVGEMIELVYASVYPEQSEYSVDVTSGIFRFSAADAGKSIRLQFNYEVPKPKLELLVDTTKTIFDFMRPGFTMLDTQHRNASGIGTLTNPHGTSFNDISQDFPIHSQIFDSGFSVYDKTDIDNVPGRRVSYSFRPYAYQSGLHIGTRYSIDLFGDKTGTVGRQYIQLPSTPIRIAYVVDSSTKRPVQFEHLGSVIHFDKPYDPDNEEYFDIGSVDISYTTIDDFEVMTLSDTSVQLKANDELVCISEGLEVPQRAGLNIDLGNYRGVPTSVVVSIDRNGDAVLSPLFLDKAPLGSKTSSEFNASKKLTSSSQIALSLKNSPLQTALKPPVGRLELVTPKSSIFGKRRFIYTYSKNATTLYMGSPEVDLPTGYNFDGASVYKDDEILDRDHWEYVGSREKIVISSAVYEAFPGASYRLVYGDSVSARNRRGFLEVSGTSSAPVGPQAICNVTSNTDEFSDGDVFSLNMIDSNVEKVFYKLGRFWNGTLAVDIADSIAASLVSDPLIVSHGVTVAVSGVSVVLTSPTQSTVSVTSKNACFKVAQFVEDNGAFKATLEILAVDFVNGDSISVNVDGVSPTVVRPFASNAFSMSGTKLDSIKLAFENDPSVQVAGFVFDIEDETLKITSGIPGSRGNSVTFQATTARNALTISSFSGGLDTNENFFDIDGAIFRLHDEQKFDNSGKFHVYCTDNLNNGASETKYFKVAEIDQEFGKTDYEFTLDRDNFNQAQVYDLEKELSISIMLFGKDAGGSAISETVVINPLVFCEHVEASNGLFNEFQFVRSKYLYSELAQWSVTEKLNHGSSELVIFSDSTSGSRDLYEVLDINWDGSAVRSTKDLRRLIQSTTRHDSSFEAGEALGTMSNLFKLALE